MIVIVVKEFNAKKMLFDSFNISQILSYIYVKFQILLSAVIKQNVKFLIDSVAVLQTLIQNNILYN